MSEHQAPWIVLAGMPGSGKSTVGRILAGSLGRSFLDLDEQVEARADMRIPEIFAKAGEAGFRELERQVIADLGEREPAVLATGGGTLLDYGNREALERLGSVVALTASIPTLAGRIASSGEERPLLAGHAGIEALEARIRDLARARQPLYDSLPWQVDTDGRTPEAVASVVQGLLGSLGALGPPAATSEGDGGHRARAIPVRRPPEALDRGGERPGYSVIVGSGLLDALGALLAARGLDGAAVVISDTNVAPLYAERVLVSLAREGILSTLLVMEAGEQAKSLDTMRTLYAGLVEAGLDRDGTVIALGGGVVGDAAGFAAASYLRGVTFVQVPTSLLAMVDASIGGKTGVNLPQGKNLVGAFKHPALVLADTETLATLPERELRGGLAEVVKTALIGHRPLYWTLIQGAPDVARAEVWAELVAMAAGVKAEIVSEDPGERGRRILLNLGHTFAHALERVSHYALAHGEAVAVGLAGAVRLAEAIDALEDPFLVEDVESTLKALGLPIRYPGADPEAILAAMGTDKKRRAGGLRFILPLAHERVVVRERLSEAAVLEVLRLLVSSGDEPA